MSEVWEFAMPTMVERRFVEDLTLSPLAYTLLIRTATRRDPSVSIGYVLPGVAREDVMSALDELVERGHVEMGPLGLRLSPKVPDYVKVTPVKAPLSAKTSRADRRVCALYRWFDSGGRLLYVGITGNLSARSRAHAKSSRWFTLSTGEPVVEWFSSRDAAAKAEVSAIKSERPLFNGSEDPGSFSRLVRYLDDIGRPELLPTWAVNRGSCARDEMPEGARWVQRALRSRRARADS